MVGLQLRAIKIVRTSIGGYRVDGMKLTLKCGAGLEKFIVKRSLAVCVFFHSYRTRDQRLDQRWSGRTYWNDSQDLVDLCAGEGEDARGNRANSRMHLEDKLNDDAELSAATCPQCQLVVLRRDAEDPDIPRIAQNRSGSSSLLVFTIRPSARTTVAEMRLSTAVPYSEVRGPNPPPRVKPPTPTNHKGEPTTSTCAFEVTSYTSPQ